MHYPENGSYGLKTKYQQDCVLSENPFPGYDPPFGLNKLSFVND